MTTTRPPDVVELRSAVALSHRIRNVGGDIQLAFAAFRLVRGGVHPP